MVLFLFNKKVENFYSNRSSHNMLTIWGHYFDADKDGDLICMQGVVAPLLRKKVMQFTRTGFILMMAKENFHCL
jgi:hypothetical protein